MTVTGAVLGSGLGFIGRRLITGDVRTVALGLVSVSGVPAGICDLLHTRWRPIQCERETPKRWVEEGPRRWAIKNGIALGCGAASRLGYWLWYVVPLGALLGGPLFGSLIYGAYGLTRSAGIWLLLLTPAAADPEWVVTEVLGRAGAARSVAGAVLVFVGAFMAGAFARGSLA
jgi:hypothetical protein